MKRFWSGMVNIIMINGALKSVSISRLISETMGI